MDDKVVDRLVEKLMRPRLEDGCGPHVCQEVRDSVTLPIYAARAFWADVSAEEFMYMLDSVRRDDGT